MTQKNHPSETFVQANGLNFCVRDQGDRDHPAVLLIMGFASQLTLWPEDFVQALIDQGFRVIRFDNRDIGLSDKVTSTVRVNTRFAFIQHKIGRRFACTYNLYDMAHDAAGVLEALQVKNAHVVGASMGGMIAQILAAKHAHRVASLTLLMTSNNSPKQALPRLQIIRNFLTIGTGNGAQSVAIERTLKMWLAIQSPAFPEDATKVRQKVEADFARSYRPGGIVRQLHAILATGSLHHLAELIAVPTLVIHGEDDPLLPPSNGRALARNIHGARHVPVAGMGHDIPEELIVLFADLIHKNAQRQVVTGPVEPKHGLVQKGPFSLLNSLWRRRQV